MSKVFLCIGTNLGNRESNLKEAVVMIREHIGRVLNYSSVYETAPWGFDTENNFLNMVIRVETSQAPDELMKKIFMVESMLGRIRKEERYSSRVIDIDILLYEDQVIAQNGLRIPHPLMHVRRFVLAPLCEIAPQTQHPVLKTTIQSLLDNCKDISNVKRYK
jgi:2-amino-4-hydroxy-6-hydroxymethyldihydropteridine diphosphokinase